MDGVVRIGAGQHITLRQTSPQAAIVESLTALMPRIVSLSVVLRIRGLEPWRSVMPGRPVAELVAQVEFAEELSGGHFAPGTRLRTMNMKCLPALDVAVVLLVGAVRLQQVHCPRRRPARR